MVKFKFQRSLLSTYVVFLIITTGFLGFLVFEGVVDEFSVKAESIIVDCNGDGNYTTIQEAINNASTGDTIYVWSGTYYENILVNKSVSLIGNGTNNTMIWGDGNDDVINVTADWVNITGFTINATVLPYLGVAIKLNGIQNCIIANNNCSNYYFGIFLSSSSHNKLINNNCSNKINGIRLKSSSWNLIEGNNCSYNSGDALRLEDSSNNIVVNNNCSNNSFHAIYSEFSSNNTISNNTCLNNELGCGGV